MLRFGYVIRWKLLHKNYTQFSQQLTPVHVTVTLLIGSFTICAIDLIRSVVTSLLCVAMCLPKLIKMYITCELHNFPNCRYCNSWRELGPGPQQCRLGAGPQHCGLGAGPQHCRLGAGPQQCRLGAGPQHCRLGAGPQHCRIGAGPHHCRLGAGPHHCRLGAGP